MLEILRNLKENVDDNDYIKQLDWSIEMISNNELYKPLFEKEDKDAANWTQFYDKGEKKKDKDKRPAKDVAS